MQSPPSRSPSPWPRRLSSFLVLLAFVIAVKLPGIIHEVESRQGGSWAVYRGDEVVLFVEGRPGPLTSSATPPPNGSRPVHPFLTASAVSAMHEHELREILDASQSVDDYLERLRRAGFRTERVAPGPR